MITTGGLGRWKAINLKVGRHVGLDFYDLLIEGDYAHKLDLSGVAISRHLRVRRLEPTVGV
jgi:hypothetical protein